MDRACPFCDSQTSGDNCTHCGRLATATRRICPACQQMSPMAEAKCCRCGGSFRSELRWKVPTIVLMFIAAIVLSVIIHIISA